MGPQEREGAPVRRRRPAVMADVGRLAGVSHQTVSRVINGSRHVSPGTRERVLAAMSELGYRPNSIARALVTGRSRTLGVVSLDTTLYGPASTLFGIERAAHEAGYFIMIASLQALDRSSVGEAIDRLRLQAVEGILVIVSDVEAAEALVAVRPDLPMVAVEGGPVPGTPVVAVDQLAGATAATRHLLEIGHRTVWHVRGPLGSIEAQQRERAWRETLIAAGVRPPALLTGDWSAHSGYELGHWLARESDATAVFVANDQMALGLLRALHEAGLEIPQDVSVVGFDDIPEAAYFLPPLTTIRQDFGELGSRSLRVLVGRLEASGSDVLEPSGSTIEPELVIRASTGPAPLRRRRAR